MRWLVWLYPADWRERYGAELEGLLEERPASARQVLDLVRGAIDARMHPVRTTSEAGGRWPMKLTGGRVAGMILLLGAVFSAWFAWQGVQRDGWMGPHDVQSDTVFLGALWALIVLGLAGVWIALRRAGHASVGGEVSFLLGLVGYLVFARDSGLLPSIGPWPAGDDVGLLGLALVVGSLVLQGGALLAARVLPLWSTLPFAVSPLLGASMLMLGFGLPGPLHGPAGLLYFSVTWLLLGWGLLLASSGEAARPRAPA
jgi:hypothetical protein